MADREINYTKAIWEALHEALTRDERVFLLGEDIGIHGNIFGVTYGLMEEFGKKRVRSSPISEAAIVGAGVGAAILGMRPMVEIMYIDFATIAMDQIVNQAAKLHYMTGGKARIPLVIRTQGGAGTGEAAQHSQSLETYFAHVPGLKVIMPATPYDAKELLLSAIEDENPVMCIEHKLLYATRGPVPEGYYTVPIGKAKVRRQGRDLSIVTYSKMVLDALEAADVLAEEGIDAEVIDLRSLKPLDLDTVVRSVENTGNLLVVHEACRTMGFAAEVIACVCERTGMRVMVGRETGEDAPIPYSKPLEERVIPNRNSITQAARSLVERSMVERSRA
jgi:pyruvate/2-oxoglutarate/acetoin dehydrogenase E1 component